MVSSNDTVCVVFGAGALGLGFLGPELAPDCRLTFLDVAVKADLVEHLGRKGSYVFNETGLSMRPVDVEGVGGLLLGEGGEADALRELLDGADLVFTAVGEPNLPRLAPLLAKAAGLREAERPLRVLCAENGVEIAANLRKAVERDAGHELAGRLLVGDTVMGRMCKTVREPAPPLRPPAPGLDWAVVAEPFFGIPVEEHVVAGLAARPVALDPQPAARFRAAEDVKMLAHNALHAALACLGWLRGAAFFDELRTDEDLMALARRLTRDEAGAALFAKHGPAMGRTAYLNYCDSILRRVVCPVFHDPIERGMRGIMRKLEPWERLVYGVRTVAEHGIEPAAVGAGLAAAVIVARRTGATELDFEGVLVQHCGFEPDADAELLSLLVARGERLA
jgi:hypothetical protein